MKKIVFVIALFVSVAVIGVISYFPTSSKGLISPGDVSGRIAANLWFPVVSKTYAQSGGPEITARAAYFVDTDTGQILYNKNEYESMPIASLTKIMTVIVALEHRNWTDTMMISDHAASMEPDSMLLKSGEKLTLEELLKGIFLVSGNDAAEAIAENTTGRREEFIQLMNSKAAFLGMTKTKFVNPSGLEEDNNPQYSSAFDVALMSRYAIKNFPHLIDISSQPHIYIEQSSTHQDYDLYSGINLLTTYPGVVGFKTGYTPEAGLTLVTVARQNGHQILGVILGSSNRREEAKELLDYSFKQIH